jgi:hypothetical protein
VGVHAVLVWHVEHCAVVEIWVTEGKAFQVYPSRTTAVLYEVWQVEHSVAPVWFMGPVKWKVPPTE